MFKQIKKRIYKFIEELGEANEKQFGKSGPGCCHESSCADSCPISSKTALKTHQQYPTKRS